MKRLFIGMVGSLYFLAAAEAQYPGNGIAPSPTPLQEVEKVLLGPVDNEALLREELQSRAPGRPPRFAIPFEVDIAPQTHGLWEKLPDGTEVWRLRISSPGAHSLNFGFLEYYMPPGGSLFVYGPGRKPVLGPFTAADNETHYQLWTPILPGGEAVLEVQVPGGRRQALRLRLATVNHDFLGFTGVLSGACNLDVICGPGDGWSIVEPYREAIRSVAVYGLGGSTFCTGFLVNNTRNDCTPYFITANHCELNASNSASVVVYWNYQNSYCREPGSMASGGPGDGQLENFNTGAIYRAGYAPTDFTLIELDDPVAENSQAFFAGWTRDAAPPEDTLACIHHPDGSEKRISFSFSDTYAGAWGSGSMPVPGGNHLIIPSWDIGSTESGSSGAPLFDRQRRVVGQLRGGAASCNNSQYDAFGWFRFSWTGGGTPYTRLKDWLDPDNTNLLFLDGRRLSGCNAGIAVADDSQEACVPGTARYTVRIGEGFSVPVHLTTSGLPSGISASFSPNPANPGETATLALNIFNASVSSGIFTFTVHAQSTYNNVETEATLALLNQPPPAPTITAPSSGAMGQTLAPAFQWTGHPLAANYELQVAADSGFTDISGSAGGLLAPYFQGLVLEPASTYYLRARGHNVCGAGPWSATVEFTTAAILCRNSPYTGPPVLISPQGANSVTSTIRVESAGAVAGIAIRNLDIEHSYVGDLSAYLQSPSGTIVHLFDRPGFPASFFGCSGANLMLSFADDALLTAAGLESTCNSYPAISGTFQPIDALSVFIGEPAEGEWKLTISDHFDQDGGQANSWELDLCSTP
ncbi:MAG: proprotein convertase P-domain-containing protein, partial [Phaeodactylibacter sp.]|nr:proprotein convertase P-domain-containing protein [Phaeodactylibacter sp.]